MTNKEQAKLLLDAANERGFKIPEHICNDCPGMACIQLLNFGLINKPTFTGEDVLWGLQATGSLIGDWDYRTSKLVKLRGYFPGPDGEVITENYGDLL